jgi:hypothetical protein
MMQQRNLASDFLHMSLKLLRIGVAKLFTEVGVFLTKPSPLMLPHQAFVSSKWGSHDTELICIKQNAFNLT